MADVLLDARGISRTHRRSGSAPTVALAPLDLTIHRGESLAIVGGSGSGKSTLVRILLGLEAPTSGRVTTGDGRSIRNRDWLRRTGIVFQDPMTSFDPRMRIGRIVTEPLRGFRLPGDHARLAEHMLERLELPPSVATRYPHELSGGQRQRVAIARALIHDPEVLIADEPLSALDVAVRASTLEFIQSLVAERSLTFVLVSHDLGVVERTSDRVVVLDAGHLVEDAPTAQLLRSPTSAAARDLIAAAPRLDIP